MFYLQDTMVLCSNLSCIRSEGWGFKSCRLQKSFSIQIDKKSLRGSQSRRKREHSLISSVRALAVRASILCGGAIWQYLCNINNLLFRNIDHRWWSKKETSHYEESKLKKNFVLLTLVATWQHGRKYVTLTHDLQKTRFCNLNGYCLMIFIRCYYKISLFLDCVINTLK